MSSKKLNSENPFTNMPKEDFLKLLDEWGIKHTPTDGIQGYIQYGDGKVESFVDGEIKTFDSLDEFREEIRNREAN